MDNVEQGHFRLTTEQRRFKAMLSAYPRFHPYWDFSARECRIEALIEDMGKFSEGEKQLACFFAVLWLGKSTSAAYEIEFDMFNAAYVLGDDERQLIIDWLKAPWYP